MSNKNNELLLHIYQTKLGKNKFIDYYEIISNLV